MAAAGLGNSLGYQCIMDGGNPRIVGGYARNAIISGGVFVFASGATGVVGSGANTFTTADLTFAGDASGGAFNGLCMQTTDVSGTISVVTRGLCLVVCNGNVTGGVKVKCDGNNAVAALSGSPAAINENGYAIGRTFTAGASGGYCVVDING